jgi:hypothetical protein
VLPVAVSDFRKTHYVLRISEEQNMRFCSLLNLLLASALSLSFCLVIQVQAASPWAIQDVQTVGALGGSALALDSNDNPHITYYRYMNNDYYNPANLIYASWNGSGWETQTLESGMECSLALDSFNNPHICYIYSTPTSSYVKYTSWTGSNWDNQTVDTSFTSSFGLDSNSLALDSNNNPHIVYNEQSDLNTTLKYASWTGSNWSIQTIDSEAPSSDFYGASVSLDSNNYPHVVYGEGNMIYGTAFNNESNVKYAEWNGQNWNIQTVFLNVSSFGNIALDSNGYPSFTYIFESSLRYASWGGSSWRSQNVDSNPLISDSSFLALDRQNNPHISYYKDAELGSETGGNLMYAYWTGSAWNIETVDNNGTDYGAGPIVLGSSGNPHISYPSFHSSDPFHYRNIKYATRTEFTQPPPSPIIVVIAVVVAITVLAVLFLVYKIKQKGAKSSPPV